MHKLFSLSFRRIVNRLNQQELNALNVAQALQHSKIPPSGEGFLHRLPRYQLKHILNVPCPINSLQEPTSSNIIASSKALRHHAKTGEEKTCSKCPFRQKCPSVNQQFTGTLDNTPKDLLIFLSGLSSLTNFQSIHYRNWVSAYKLGDNIIAQLNDLAQGGKEIEQFEVERLEISKQNTEKFGSQGLQKQAIPQQTIKPKQEQKVIRKQEKVTRAKQHAQGQIKEDGVSQQILGRDFSFDETEQFQPQNKVSKDNHEAKKQEHSQQKAEKPYKNQKGYKFIEKNERFTENKFQKPQYKQFQRRQYQQINQELDQEGSSQKFSYKKDERYYKKRDESSFQRQPRYQNRENYQQGYKRYNREEQFQRKPKFQNRRNDYENPKRNERYNDNYQNKKFDNRQNQRQFGEKTYEQRRPYKNYQQNDDWRGQKRYQNQQSQPQTNQREQKNQKPNPFISKWNPEQTSNYPESRDFRQPKSNPTEQNNAFNQKRQAEQVPRQQPKVRIIQTENIQQRSESEGRAGRNVRRRPRTASDDDIKTTTE